MKSTLATRFIFVACAVLPFQAHADNPRSYAVLSLIGDSITFVSAHPVTGSVLDQNGHHILELPPEAIDNVALLAADDAIRKADSHASTVLMAVSSKSLRDQQSQLISEGRLTDSSELSDALKKSGAAYLVLITKHRADAELQAERQTLGNGTLYGLGYYIDRHKMMYRTDTGQSAEGYLAPYTYFNIYLVDVATSKVLGEHTVMASRTISNANNTVSSDPWDILNGDEKLKVLDEMVQRQISRAMPSLIH